MNIVVFVDMLILGNMFILIKIRNFWEYGKTGNSGTSDDLLEFHNFDGLVESHDPGKVGDPGKSGDFGDCGDSSESRDSG